MYTSIKVQFFNSIKISKTTKRCPKSWKWIIQLVCLLCLLLCVRLGTLFYKCREEQEKCQSSDIIVSLEKIYGDQSYKALRLAISLFSATFPVVIYLSVLCNKFNIKATSIPALCIKYGIFFLCVLTCLRWWLNIVSPNVVEKILKGNEIILTQCSFLGGIFLCIILFSFPILPERPWEMSSKQVYLGSCVSLLFLALQLLFLLLGDALSPANTLMGASTLLYCLLLHSAETTKISLYEPTIPSEHNMWLDVLSLHLLARHWFYAAAHQAVFSSVHWDAAFLLSKEVHSNLLSGVLVLLNTFSSYIFHGLALPIVLINSEAAVFTSHAMLRLHMKYLLCFGLKLLGSVAASFILRRHLMVWAIFTPKLIYEALAMAITMICITVSHVFMIKLSSRYLELIRMNLGHMFAPKNE